MPVSGGTTRKLSERVLSPAKERVAFLVARELELGVQLERVGLAEVVDLHRVIDDELHRLQRVDAVGIAAEARDGVAHGREIDDTAGTPVKSCSSTRAGANEISRGVRALDVPARERLDVGRLDEAAVLVAQQVLEQDLQRERQPRDLRKASGLKGGQAEVLNGASASLQRLPGLEAVHSRHAVGSLENGIVPHRDVEACRSPHVPRVPASPADANVVPTGRVGLPSCCRRRKNAG